MAGRGEDQSLMQVGEALYDSDELDTGAAAGGPGLTQMNAHSAGKGAAYSQKDRSHMPATLDEVFDDDGAVFENERDVDDIDPKSNSPLSTVLGVACFPLTLMCSWYAVQEQEEVVVLNFGKYTGTETTPGIHFSNCFGRTLRRVSTQKKSIDLPSTKVVDGNGNPLLVSGIVVYHIVNTKRATIDMRNADQYVSNQARAVMRQVVSKFPYEHLKDGEQGPTLKGESADIGNRLVSILQRKVAIAGAKVLSFQFDEISYAPEIAQGMLKRQQAMATVAARTTIVAGAVEIAHGAIMSLEARGTQIDPNERGKIMANLLTVIAGESGVQPTMNVGST
jgi:regulator of protease activity HflC (stomatin/prohibitin superfamily)